MANVYSPEQLGIKPPPGGFQQGGWYEGRQYWNGTLSEPGVIHPQSNQSGAGQAVSSEVIAQTNPANVAYIEKLKQEAAKTNITPVASYNPPTTQPTTTSTTTSKGAITGFNQPTIDLPNLYQNLYKSSGISEKEAQIAQLEKQYLEARNKITDNPFLDAATMDKRLARLKNKYEEETLPLRNEISMKKADIETQLNIQTKQFDINSQQAQLALQQFNTLLATGAFDNATGEDIANITRATGLSSTMIQSAIQAKKDKDIQTSTISFDDGTNQGFVVINSRTGEILNKQIVAPSKPKSTGSGELTTTQARNVTSVARKAIIEQDTNEDKLLSKQEYINAVTKIMIESGVDFATADNYATSAFNDLGYKKWKW